MKAGGITVRRAALIGVAGTVAGIAVGAAGAQAVASGGGSADRAAIERIVHDYILAHPEIIPEALDRLQERSAAKAIADERKTLEAPFGGAWAGDERGDVTLVMFSDYNCGYCRASASVVERLLKEDPRLRVVWREIPVLGPQSEAAARAALAAARLGKYPEFHRALFASGRPDERGVNAAARKAGIDPGELVRLGRSAEVTAELEANLALAGRLGVSGTPAFVVGDRLLPGAVGYDPLKAAIAAARKG